MNHLDVIERFKNLIGTHHVLTSHWNKLPHTKGWRYGSGSALAVLKPGHFPSSEGEYFKFLDKSTILSGSSKKLSTIKFGYISRQVVFRMVLNRILL